MNASGRIITGAILATATASFALLVAGFTSPGGVAPDERAFQSVPVIRPDATPTSAVNRPWTSLGGNRVNELAGLGLEASSTLAAVSASARRSKSAADVGDAA